VQQTSIVALIGARRRDRLAESLEALPIGLSPEQMVEIEQAIPRGGGPALSGSPTLAHG
jgi:aryl-alcohol dehydrogenase-like predicted oxidoreductase